MAVKGNERENVGERKLYVGLTAVEPKAFNPSRKDLSKLLGQDEKEGDEYQYSSQDADGNERQRMTFWLYDSKIKQYFVYSFLLVNKVRTNKNGDKVQLVNTTCDTTWVPLKEDGEPDYDFLDDPKHEWFKTFKDKENKNVVGTKGVRKALVGEEELVTFIKAWLGTKLNFSQVGAEVTIDVSKLFKEKYSEVRELIENKFAGQFTILVGVKTDETDVTKKYQQVYGKSFLPGDIMKFVNNGFTFPAGKDGKPNWFKKQWDRFKEEVDGEHGPKFHVELVPLKEYDEREDATSSTQTKKGTTEVAKTSSEY